MKKTLHMANLDVMIHFFRFHLLLRLKEEGYEVHVAGAITNLELVKDFEDAGFIFHEIPIARGLNPKNALKCITKVRALVKKEKFDIIHTNTPTGGMIGRLGAYLGGQKEIYHTTAGFYFHENMSSSKYKFYSGIEKYLATKTTILFSPNKEDIQTCYKLNIKPKNDIVYCGPSGVDIERYPIENKQNYRIEVCRELKISENSFIVGAIGRLVWEKGYKEYIDTIALLQERYENIVGICVGRGPQKEEILEYASKKNVDCIKFIGYTTEVPKYLMSYDVLLFPSYREGFPISTLEAMASETPVIAFDIRGCRESVVENITGHIVAFKDVDAMFEKVCGLIEDTPKQLQMGVNGRKRVMDQFLKIHHIENQMPYY